MIDRRTAVRLAPKARLRFDKLSGKHMLLYPERGLALSETAARITTLCATEALTAGAIAEQLAAAYPDQPRAQIESEVVAYLRSLDERGLLIVEDA
ncbi:MAG TPA: pyrroloquinoline quinone biosynthesis peptide chaperone PqqD [Polyangia bacterium]|jgi:coenzyme PQQ biosynthesis protein PqqD|nr:pyrroloquinoline quinone biosynthesis peptide chaperone PqqD [Polyangia bacterium]